MKPRSLLFVLCLVWTMSSASTPPESFEQAKTISAETGKPVLLEFVHED